MLLGDLNCKIRVKYSQQKSLNFDFSIYMHQEVKVSLGIRCALLQEYYCFLILPNMILIALERKGNSGLSV